MAWLLAGSLHLALFLSVFFRTEPPEPFRIPETISVELVERPVSGPQAENTRTSRPSIPLIRPRRKPERRPDPTENLKPGKTMDSTVNDTPLRPDAEPLPDRPRPGAPATANPNGYHPRWALEPPLKADRLEGLGLLKPDIDCLRALSDDCRDLRAEIFSDYALSEYEKHVVSNTPWSGLGGDFYGLSEREILEKLNVPIAGQNGLSVPILGTIIDGPIWDAMHGVNKGCRLVRNLDPDSPMGVSKVCPGQDARR